MKVYALWYGGSSYAAPTLDDLEEFDSCKEARYRFQARYDNNSYGEPDTPCVSDESEMHIFKSRPGSDPYPDLILKFGPRGGVRTERC